MARRASWIASRWCAFRRRATAASLKVTNLFARDAHGHADDTTDWQPVNRARLMRWENVDRGGDYGGAAGSRARITVRAIIDALLPHAVLNALLGPKHATRRGCHEELRRAATAVAPIPARSPLVVGSDCARSSVETNKLRFWERGDVPQVRWAQNRSSVLPRTAMRQGGHNPSKALPRPLVLADESAAKESSSLQGTPPQVAQSSNPWRAHSITKGKRPVLQCRGDMPKLGPGVCTLRVSHAPGR